MKRLTARRIDNGLAYLVGVKPNEQEVDSPHPNTLRCILECFQSLAAYEDTGLTPGNITYQTAQLQEWQRKCNLMHRDNTQLRAELEQVKAERDAAVEALCGNCAYCIKESVCLSRQGSHKNCWRWRGFMAGDRSGA
jgi:hypothetical protein